MKKLRSASLLVLAVTFSMSALWHGADWVLRVNIIVMLAAVSALMFSSAKLRKEESRK